MEYSCEFAPFARFGSYPYSHSLTELWNEGTRVFVDVTCGAEEQTPPYDDVLAQISDGRAQRLAFPIPDMKSPADSDLPMFSRLVDIICEALRAAPSPRPVYIHCRGGHGRSALVAACVLIRLHGMSSEEALEAVDAAHDTRLRMRRDMREIGAPQTRSQVAFVRTFARHDNR